MATVQDHYHNHLGPVYQWMLGDFDAACSAAAEELEAVGVSLSDGDLVVDLGCGVGQFALTAARRGATVLAIDSCESLLAELDECSGDCDIQTVPADLCAFRNHVERSPSVIICMGDTITHLPDENTVRQLLQDAAEALDSGGVFLASFRDYTGEPPTGIKRFIPVRADTDRILTCCIEYESDSVTVTDLLHTRAGETWEFQASSYCKVRLDPAFVASVLQESGCAVRVETGFRGMTRIFATR